MTPELWQQVSSALDQMLELSPAEQVHFLQKLRSEAPGVCREVESLLGQMPSDLLESPPPDLLADIEPLIVDSGTTETLGYNTNPTENDDSLATLRNVGHYVVQDEIARGGMGAVLRVLDPAFGRVLAIKVLLPQARLDSNAKRRFLQEAQITGRLQHPGIPPIHELGRLEDGTPFFAMKLIEGKTLAKLLNEAGTTRMDARFVGIFEQICRTLAYAHSKGILHRDLKPSNVMVGAFGEVQVMDWGLAKPIAGHEPLARQPLGNARDVNQGIDSISLAGDVMGTPAYIAPEQARGEIDQLDERCDVFGLGGILCAMLIGRPPFIGSVADMLHQASRGDLSESFAQLDRCGADSDLVMIAKRCLAPNLADRYRNGAEAADAVTSHREGVQERLAQAEVARARAQVQAGEERRRRRLTLSFSAIVLLMIVAAGGAGFLYQSERQRLKQEQSQREIDDAKRQAELLTTREKVTREVTEALDSAEKSRVAYQRQLSDPIQTAKLLGDLNQWEAILTDGHHAWKRANAVAAGNRPLLDFSLLADVDEMEVSLAADQLQLDIAKKLDQIRLGVAARVDGWFETSRAGPEYTKLFQAELELDLKQTNPEQSAAKIRESPIRFALVATLDHWALALSGNGDPELLTRLLEVARQADPDPVRNQFRNPKIWQDGKNLQKLAEAIDVASQPPPFLSALAVRLKIAEGDPVPLLRVALVYHPRDFWLNVELGLQQAGPNSNKNGEAAGYLQAALAVRPNSPVVYAALGNVLSHHNDFAGAVAAYRQAVQLDPAFADAYCNLGIALRANEDPTGAVVAFRKALDNLDYRNDLLTAWIYYNMGEALKGRGDEAASAFKKAMDNLGDTNTPLASQIRLGAGMALERQGRLDEAMAAYRKATQVDPNLIDAYYSLGKLLMEQKELTAAVATFQDALEKVDRRDDRKAGLIHFYLGATHYRQKNYAEAIVAHQNALKRNPDLIDANYELGKTLMAHGDPVAAVIAFQQGADKLGDNQNRLAPSIYFQMGKALEFQGQFEEALTVWRKWQHLPGWPDPKGAAVKSCERLRELDSQLSAVLQGQVQPKDAEEMAKLAYVCLVHRKLPVAAVRFYQVAFPLDPKMPPRLQYQAACAAVSAAAGQGKDVDKLTDIDKAKLRQQAHSWLTAQLAHNKDQLKLPTMADKVRGELRQWEQNPELATVRDLPALAKLPAEEQRSWQAFWMEVAENAQVN